MNKISTVLVFTLLFLSRFSFAQCEVLVWEDNFNGSSLNLDHWDYEYGNGCPGLCGWGNNELQHYTDAPENITVANGTLRITAQHSPGSNPEYTSARIRTKGLAAFRSGRIEARIKMPIGQGLWPAFWMLPEDYSYGGWPLSGEIDITEVLGQTTNETHGTIHYGGKWPFNQYQGNSLDLGGTALHDNFHVYAVEWKQDTIRWFIDEQLYSIRAADNLGTFPWRFDQEFHLLLNLAIGGNWPGFPDNTTVFPQNMLVDYVRIYEKPELAIISGPKSAFQGEEVHYDVSNLENCSFSWNVENGTIESSEGPNCTVVFNESGNQNISVSIDNGNCASTIEREINVGDECSVNIANFDDRFDVHWTWYTGSYGVVSTPSQGPMNNSPSASSWSLEGNSDDRITYGIDAIQDANVFSDQHLVIGMKMYSNAPENTLVEMRLQNENITGTGVFNGTHSNYLASTGEQYGWTWVYFDLGGVSNASLNEDINQMMFRVLASPSLPYTLVIDDVSFFDFDCTPLANNIEAVNATEEMQAYVKEGSVYVRSAKGKTLDVLDISGRIVQSVNLVNGEAQIHNLKAGHYFIKSDNLLQKAQRVCIY